MSCSELQCVAVDSSLFIHVQSSSFDCVYCSVFQGVTVCCSVLQCVAVYCSVFQGVTVCCSVLQCVAVCCSVLQGVAVCCSTLQHTATH